MHKMKTILFASGKGGTGKTISAINFSLALHYQNKKVLLVDGNIHKPNINFHFNLPNENTLHHIFTNNIHPYDTIKIHPSGLHLVLGNHDIESFDSIDYRKFSEALFQLKNCKYDYMIIDSASNFTHEFFYAAKHSDETIVVTQPNSIALHDAEKTIKLCEDEGSSVMGVIINNFGYKKRDFQKSQVESMLKKYIYGILPHDRHVEKSIQAKHPVICSFPNSKISKEFLNIGRIYSGIKK
jgi:septum site-determining protein MinD